MYYIYVLHVVHNANDLLHVGVWQGFRRLEPHGIDLPRLLRLRARSETLGDKKKANVLEDEAAVKTGAYDQMI